MPGDEISTYRVKSINAGANTKQTTWVRASSRRQAEQWVRERYSRHYIASALPRTPPDDADVQEAIVDAE